MKNIILIGVADFSNGATRQTVVIKFCAGSYFTGEDNYVAFYQDFAGDVALFVLLQAGIENGVGNVVGNLIGMPLPYRFGRENEFLRHNYFSIYDISGGKQAKYQHIRIL